MPAVITGDGGSIAYPKVGSGPRPVLLIPDWLFSGMYWQDVMDALPHDRFTVMMPDLRGTGLSHHPEAGGHDLDRFADDLVSLMSQESAFDKKWILVGHGMGALLAQRAAAVYKRKVGGLVLVAPMPLGGMAPEGEAGELAKELAADRDHVEEILPFLFAGEVDEDDADLLLDDFEQTSDAYLSETFAQWSEAGDSEKIAKIRCPMLLVTGGKDQLIPEAAPEQIAALAKSASRKSYPEAGHMIPIEAPGALVEDICAFEAALEE
ncbi:MAG: alpha/beta hydrolase [Chrysiogenetes bacterium]|nr:alpha/beta hydrolase [Chrysiogenetes bacterium]